MSEHYHTHSCLEMETEDYTNSKGGEAWTYYSCKVTGESHRSVAEFQIEELDS